VHCDAVYFSRWRPMFRKYLSPPFSGRQLPHDNISPCNDHCKQSFLQVSYGERVSRQMLRCPCVARFNDRATFPPPLYGRLTILPPSPSSVFSQDLVLQNVNTFLQKIYILVLVNCPSTMTGNLKQ
jgi:hypothetical protein